jgi:outer membrane protein TolC
LDIRRALAQYAATEANVQLEIAKQYPDINIGPGYTFEERHSFLTGGLSVVLPVFNRNEGPIAEAEARRQEAAATVVETQARVIARSERALAVYTAATREVAEAESLHRLQEAQRRVTEQAIRAGANNRLGLDAVDIQVSVFARAYLDALARAQRALGDLEDAVQHPLTPEGMLPFAPETLLKIVPVNR